MSNLRINFIDEWEKKDVNLEELRHALEDGNSSVYTDASFKKVSSKCGAGPGRPPCGRARRPR